MAATESQVALWRAAIAFAWIDNELHEDEKQQLRAFFENNVHLSDEQQALLHQSIEQRVSLEDAWAAVTDKHDRAHLINIAPVIFWQDDAFNHSEKEAFARICKDHESTLDLTHDREEAQKMAAQFRIQWAQDAKAYAELRSRMGPVGWVMHQLQKKLG